MKLQEMTWQEVDALPRQMVVMIPTGSLEQHGPHLPLFTDSLIVTAVANAVEANAPLKILLTPTLWLGASQHHLAFAGSLSNTFEGYVAAITSVIKNLESHGFTRFFVLNGHGGNREPNGVATRAIKEAFPNLQVGHAGYFEFCAATISETLKGPLKTMAHGCEAETSLMMHLHPELVRRPLVRDDGLTMEPSVLGMVHHFDEITEEGSRGFATYASPETGKLIFESAVSEVTKQLIDLSEGYVFTGLPKS